LFLGASFDNWLDAVDESFCTYKGGDDPEQDGIYPDPFPGGYEGIHTVIHRHTHLINLRLEDRNLAASFHLLILCRFHTLRMSPP